MGKQLTKEEIEKKKKVDEWVEEIKKKEHFKNISSNKDSIRNVQVRNIRNFAKLIFRELRKRNELPTNPQPLLELFLAHKPETKKEYLRKLATKNAQEINFKLFDTYKKGHGMASYT